MILFFGTRPGKEINKNLNGISCTFCKQVNTLSAKIHSNYFHLFWIKLFKISKQETIECSHCKKVYFKEEFTDEMRHSLQKNG